MAENMRLVRLRAPVNALLTTEIHGYKTRTFRNLAETMSIATRNEPTV